MLHLENPEIRSLLLQGKFGLEKEGLRVLADASMAHTPHPLNGVSHVSMDFSENQTEINTSTEPSAEGAVEALEGYECWLQRIVSSLPVREYIWPFSNPPYLAGEEDIPIAQFTGELVSKTAYREYLSGRYGRYKMTFSGIHVNYSFSEELLREEFTCRGVGRFRSFRDSFYLELAEKCAAYGWILVILTAASPIIDASFFEAGLREKQPSERKGLPAEKGFSAGKGASAGREPSAERDPSAGKNPGAIGGRDLFTGMASIRCSELGYWNAFPPVFDYSNIQRYSDSIRSYVNAGLLYAASELYYPVRLKPKGEYSLEGLKEGVDHLELRMFDINPFTRSGLDVRDVQFAQLFLIWLASIPRRYLSPLDQVLAVQNFQNAAHYDLRTVKIVMPELRDEAAASAEGAALYLLDRMRDFYLGIREDIPDWVPRVLEFERKKIVHPETRYAARAREQFSGTFLEKGMERAVSLQEECCCCRK